MLVALIIADVFLFILVLLTWHILREIEEFEHKFRLMPRHI